MEKLYLFKLNTDNGTIARYEVKYERKDVHTVRGTRFNCIDIKPQIGITDYRLLDDDDLDKVGSKGISLFSFCPDIQSVRAKFIDCWCTKVNRANVDFERIKHRTMEAKRILDSIK